MIRNELGYISYTDVIVSGVKCNVVSDYMKEKERERERK